MSTEKKLKALKADCMQMASAAHDDLLAVTESPIEALFLSTMLARGWREMVGHGCGVIADHAAERLDVDVGTGPMLWNNDSSLICVPQMAVALNSGRRVDFAFLSPPEEEVAVRIAVELDGHDFHEKTKEQASRDKKRDRDFVLAGWTVLRFSGSDIYRSAHDALREVEDLGSVLLVPERYRARVKAARAARSLRGGR